MKRQSIGEEKRGEDRGDGSRRRGEKRGGEFGEGWEENMLTESLLSVDEANQNVFNIF